MQRILHLLMSLIAGLWFATSPALAGSPDEVTGGACPGLPTNAQLQHFLQQAASGQGISGSLGPNTAAGGLFQGERMWGAVVNREGRLCAFITSTADPTQVWPGSQAIAKAKAFTANGFSLDDFVLSTARLYTFALPGHSLFGLNQSNAFNPLLLAPPGGTGGRGLIAGGIITFGGGVPLYAGGKIVGGLGVSGDTACTDHEIAKRVRDLAGLNPPGGPLVDDIVYEPASIFAHPLCINTMQNGVPRSPDEVPLPLP
ncbi:MAG TPA: heme-binding protein [Candidatus Tectomicrobia bacterium]|nr:heme-binding protein [Candidatus Tectomicrobia bacterium]